MFKYSLGHTTTSCSIRIKQEQSEAVKYMDQRKCQTPVVFRQPIGEFLRRRELVINNDRLLFVNSQVSLHNYTINRRNMSLFAN